MPFPKCTLDLHKNAFLLYSIVKFVIITLHYVRLSDSNNFITVACLNHATLHEAESAMIFSTVYFKTRKEL